MNPLTWAFWADGENEPGWFLRKLRDANMLPSVLSPLVGCEQDPEWHPEGDAFEHTAYVCDAMRDICIREGIEGTHRRTLMYAALLHDTGKPAKTIYEEKNGQFRWTSPGHELVSEAISYTFTAKLDIPDQQAREIGKLCRWHMSHCQKHPWTVRAVRRLYNNLEVASFYDLMLLMEADCNGRPPHQGGLSPNALSLGRNACNMGYIIDEHYHRFEDNPSLRGE